MSLTNPFAYQAPDVTLYVDLADPEGQGRKYERAQHEQDSPEKRVGAPPGPSPKSCQAIRPETETETGAEDAKASPSNAC